MKNAVRYILIFFIFQGGLRSKESADIFKQIYPFNSFKGVVDTCVRSYTDVLLLHDEIANNEKTDEAIDLLVGRLMRLGSYIEQVIYAYKNEATVSFDELDYLMKMLEYLEITLEQGNYPGLANGLNTIIIGLKSDLQRAMGIISLQFIPMPRYHFLFPPLEYHSLLFV